MSKRGQMTGGLGYKKECGSAVPIQSAVTGRFVKRAVSADGPRGLRQWWSKTEQEEKISVGPPIFALLARSYVKTTAPSNLKRQKGSGGIGDAEVFRP